MQKIALAISLLLLTSVVFAAAQLPVPSYYKDLSYQKGIPYQPKFYGGFAFGYGDLHYAKSDFVGNVTAAGKVTGIGSVGADGYAARIYGGYAYNRYLGAEVGYTFFRRTELSRITASGAPGVSVRSQFAQQVLDLVAKLTLPIGQRFGLFVRGGAAWVHRDIIGGTRGTTTIKLASRVNYIRPTLGLGADYYITPNLFAAASWMRVFGTSSLEDSDFVGLGFGYQVNLM